MIIALDNTDANRIRNVFAILKKTREKAIGCNIMRKFFIFENF